MTIWAFPGLTKKDETVRKAIKVALAVMLAGMYGGALVWAMMRGLGAESSPGRRPVGPGGPRWVKASSSMPSLPLFGSGGFESAGYGTAARFTGPIADRGSIEQLCAAYASRARRGIAEQTTELAAIPLDAPDPTLRRLRTQATIAFLHMYDGNFREAAEWIERALRDNPEAPRELRANFEALLGVIHLRRGETENCLDCRGPSSCIFPIVAEAVHQQPSGSRAAIEHFTAYLKRRPEDLGVRWLLNVAYMTLGEYPDRVPAEWRIPLEPFRSRLDIGRFENVAPQAGLNSRGPNMAGGSIFDDFTGDGAPDVITTSFDTDLGASLFVNRGDGTFEDRSESAGLQGQPLSVNAAQADFDNDGRLDVIMVRGGWENAARLTLLHNIGQGRFEDVTIATGLGEPIASHSAAWGDFDNDGRVDLYVCGEFASSSAGLFADDSSLIHADPRNHCRLYRNNGDGTFTDVADKAGVRNDRYAKGAAWGDFDNDGDADLFVSNFGEDNRLYRNNGDGTFVDVARELGVTERAASFACGFIDYDNDGRLDLFVDDYGATLEQWVAGMIGRRQPGSSHPHLYHNEGPSGFHDVASSAGMDRPALAMGMGIGDVDNDGFLDIYLATGRPDYSALMPNVLYKNVDGRHFEDISTSSGTGHLQKGHGVSFADHDGDGDLDLFVEVGGAVPGDRAHNLLFRNPGQGRHWLGVKLVGQQTNRAAIGARIEARFTTRDGSTRSVYRQIGATSSYGGSSLVEHIGLADAEALDALTVTWPVSHMLQTFHHVPADHTIEITEGAQSPRVMVRPSVRK
jgi:tetratricopeptide (TPR) repeat protein